MKSNFDFLNRYWPALAQIGATAETYVYSDPNACIYKLGMFAERLVQEILVFEHIAEPAVDNTHANRIRILKRAGLLPHEIDNTLYVLRKTRNSAVHIGTDSVDEAKTLLSLTYNLAVWFMETYGDWGYIAPEFVMPSETTHEDLESVIAEQERKIEELTKQLAVVKTAASGKTQKERAKRSESVSAMMNWNEAQTRCLIDEQLRLSGWEADTQNLRYSKGTRPVKGRNIAISEWPTNSAFYKNGYADYAFFIGEKLVALMDAKKMSEDVASTIDVQVKDYAAHIKPEDIPHTVGNWNGYQVPFLFASNGRAYLEQLRTKSGIWFLDVREQENQPYPIRNWFSPSDLMEKLGQNTVAANQALAAADNSFMTDPNGLNLRDYQIKAKAAILHKAFTGELTAKWREEHGVGMESWKKKSVGELCISLKYGTAKKSDASGNVVVLRMGNLQQGEIDWSDLAYSNDPDDIEKYKLFPGDVLFNRTNSAALVGKTAIYRGEHPAIYAGYLIKLDYDHDKIIGDYLNYALNTLDAKKYCNSVKTDGVNQSNINAKKIGAYSFNVPSIPEQEKTV